MLIRSQDKLKIVNINNISCIYAYEEGLDSCGEPTKYHRWEVMADDSTERPIRLGQYSSEEKVIKVLDRIYDAYAMANINFNVVFQMPQDEEV